MSGDVRGERGAKSSRPGIHGLDDRLRLALFPSPKAYVRYAAITDKTCERYWWPPMFREESCWDIQIRIGGVAVVRSHCSGAKHHNIRSTGQRS